MVPTLVDFFNIPVIKYTICYTVHIYHCNSLKHTLTMDRKPFTIAVGATSLDLSTSFTASL